MVRAQLDRHVRTLTRLHCHLHHTPQEAPARVMLRTRSKLFSVSFAACLLLMAICPSLSHCASMQKQTQTCAEKVRQEERGHTRGPLFVWAYLGLLKSLQQRGNTVGT